MVRAGARPRPKTVLFVTHHIDEAVMLADRVLVFSPAPGRVLEVVSVPTAAPAQPEFRRDPRFIETAAHIRGLLFGLRVRPAMTDDPGRSGGLLRVVTPLSRSWRSGTWPSSLGPPAFVIPRPERVFQRWSPTARSSRFT